MTVLAFHKLLNFIIENASRYTSILDRKIELAHGEKGGNVAQLVLRYGNLKLGNRSNLCSWWFLWTTVTLVNVGIFLFGFLCRAPQNMRSKKSWKTHFLKNWNYPFSHGLDHLVSKLLVLMNSRIIRKLIPYGNFQDHSIHKRCFDEISLACFSVEISS